MIGDEISCLRNFGPLQLNDAATHCESLNANQILPKSRQESDDLVSALLSLNLKSENTDILVSLDIHKTKKGEWHDSAGQPISYFNWLLPQGEYVTKGEYVDLTSEKYSNYAGFRFNEIKENIGWAKFNGTNELNVVCTKRAGHGERF